MFAPKLLIQYISSLSLFAEYWIACWLLNLHCIVLQFRCLSHFMHLVSLPLSHSLFAAVGNRKAIGNNFMFVIRPIREVPHIHTKLKQSKCYSCSCWKSSVVNIDVDFIAYNVTIIRWFLLVVQQWEIQGLNKLWHRK